MPANNDLSKMSDDEINAELADRLGIDRTAKTDKEIASAVASGFDPIVCGPNRDQRDVIWNGASYTLWFCSAIAYWEGRANRHYQSDIEAHVAAWRKPPPNYCGSLEGTRQLMASVPALYWPAWGRRLSEMIGCAGSDAPAEGVVMQTLRLTPRQLAEAALKVLREAQNEA